MLSKMFAEDFCLENEFNTIFARAAALNTIYSTHVFKIYDMVKNINNEEFNKLVKEGNPDAVDKIRYVEVNKDGKKIDYYSFATKYCSFCNPDKYPIYDRNVEYVLRYLKDVEGFESFKLTDLKKYKTFIDLIDTLKEKYKLSCNYKDLDHYLWGAGDIIINSLPKKQRSTPEKI